MQNGIAARISDQAGDLLFLRGLSNSYLIAAATFRSVEGAVRNDDQVICAGGVIGDGGNTLRDRWLGNGLTFDVK